MAKKVILKDLDNVEILPITRGELIVDSSGKEAFHSNEFLATNSLPGLMSPEEKAKLSTIAGNTIDSALSTTSVNPVQNKVVTVAINEAKQLANDALETANDASENVSKVQQIINSIKESYLKSATVNGNVLTIVDLSDSEITFTNTTYNTFLKETAANTGGRNGLVPKPNYNDGSKTRFLREDGTWVIPTNTSYTFANGTDGSFTVTPSGGSGQKVTIGKPATAGTADKVSKALTIKIKTGTTEDTDVYTYDGSKAKTLDIKAGANITLTPTAGVLTIAATNSNTTYTLSGALDGNTFVTTLTPSSGTATTAVIPAMVGATSSAAGKAGLVPAPAANKHTSFLRGDGTWVVPTDTKNTAGSTNSTSKLFLIGATSQASNSQTYSNSSVYTTNGTLYATTFIGNLDGTYINKLTGYKIAEAISSIATTDSLNTALGKLEFKTDFIYNDLFGTDNDDVINKWHEIVDFVDSVAEGTDITDEFVTRKTSLTITGLKTFLSNSSATGISLVLKNSGWYSNMSTAMDFYNGSSYTVPNARIETKMVGNGNAGGTLIFYTQTKHASTNPNPNGLTERLRISDSGLTTITGALTITGDCDFSAGTIKFDTISIPTTSGGTTYGVGSSGQVLKSNGTTVYWASDNNSDTWRPVSVNGTSVATSTTGTGTLNIVLGTGITVSGAVNSLTITNAGVRSVTIGTSTNADKLAVNTNGSTTYLTIPYATTAANTTVILHNTNDTEYPLIWSNQNNNSTKTANLLYKSYSDLTYNPKNKRITANIFKGNLLGNINPFTNLSYTSGTSTVKNIKDALVTAFSNINAGIGANVVVPAYAINYWSTESTVILSSNVYSMIKIGGGYSGTTYGLWLLSTYASYRIGYVGRDGNAWGSVYWLATTTDIDTLKNYYWANVKISKDSSTTTTPTFANTAINGTLTMGGVIVTQSGSSTQGIKFGTSYLNLISNLLLWLSSEAIRFGSSQWDWNLWAGLKYVHSSKTIHLGLADGTIFNANSSQSGGTLNLPGISNIVSSYYNVAIGHITSHTHTTTGGWYRVAKLKKYFNYDIHISGSWSTGMPSVIKVNICQINGTAKITQLSGYVGLINSQIRLGKVATDEWDVLFYSSGFSSGTMALQNFVFFGIGNITTYTTNTISTTSYTSTLDLAFKTLSGVVLTTDNYGSYLGYIGTTAVLKSSAAQALTGITNATLSGKLIFTTAATTASISFLNGELIDGYGNVLLGTNSTSWNVFNSSRSSLITALNSGNVGIGTTSPSLKLHVNGNAIATNFGVNSTAGSGQGISLYGGSGYVSTYGIAFVTTGNWETHGYVTGDWATYFTMSNTENRGWIFRRSGSGNVFSIDCDGHAYANGLVNASRFNSRVAAGTQPYACTSTTCNINLNADLLDGYHRKGLYSSIPAWINANEYTVTVTVSGSADTYYPVVISTPTDKEFPGYISVWKNLGSTTASYSGNHSSGTSSMWLLYEVRNWYWDGNGGYLKCWYYSMPYATLCAKAEAAGSGVGKLVVYLRGGGTLYKVSSTYGATATVYTALTNIGSSSSPVNVAPTTSIGNRGQLSNTYLGYGSISGSSGSVRDAGDSTAITLKYSSGGFTSNPAYLAAWNGYQITYVAPSYVTVGTATKASYLAGFSTGGTASQTWGNQTGTGIHYENDSTGGSFEFRRDNPSSGKVSFKVDGRVYVSEGTYPVIASVLDGNGYPGLLNPDGASTWIRVSNSASYGLLPNQSGGAGNGHGYLGTSSWYFKYAYIDQIYGYLNGSISGNAAYASSAGYTTRLYANSTSNLITSPGDYSLAYSRFLSGVSNIFPVSNNANGCITAHLHSGNYFAQIGLSSNGRMYYRTMMAQTLDAGVGWNKVAFSTDTMSYITVTDSDANSTYRMVWHSGSSLYSTAGIYCNPSTDYLYASSMNASNWFRSSGNTGWYNPTNECHVYPNNISTYGGLILRGIKSSYHGFLLGTSTSYMNVMSTDTHHGLYCENTGLWEFYYNRANKQAGILTSSLTSGHALTVGGNISVVYNSYPGLTIHNNTTSGESSIYVKNNTAGWAIGVNTWGIGAGLFAIGLYSGTGSSSWRFRIDNNGYCYTNSYLNIGGHEKNASSPTYVWGSNSSDTFLRSYLTSKLSVSYAASAGSVAWANVTGKPTIPTDTWRGVINNLTSTSTTDSLTANMGRVLANGLSDLPVVLLAGTLYRSSAGTTTTWYFTGIRHRSVSSTNPTVSVSGGVACFTFTANTGYTFSIYGVCVNHQASGEATYYTSTEYKTRSSGLYWFGAYASGRNLYIRAISQGDQNNDTAISYAGQWNSYDDGVTRIQIIAVGYAY